MSRRGCLFGYWRRGAATSTSWVSFGSRGVWRSPCEFIAAPLPFSPSPSNVAALGSLNARQPVRWFIHRPQSLDDCPPARRKRPRKPSAWFGSVGARATAPRPCRRLLGGVCVRPFQPWQAVGVRWIAQYVRQPLRWVSNHAPNAKKSKLQVIEM